MFTPVQSQVHTTNQKLQCFVWEIFWKSLHFKNLTCSVLLQILIREMITPLQTRMHDRKIIICGPY